MRPPRASEGGDFMGLFGKKKTETGTTTQLTQPSKQVEGWVVECGPQCGFMVRNPNKQELATLVQTHMKNSHKTNLTEAEALADAKTVTWAAPVGQN